MAARKIKPEPRVARSLVKSLVVEREPRRFRHCCFCGAPTYGRACRAHHELLEVGR